MTKLHVVLGNQLFPIEYIKKMMLDLFSCVKTSVYAHMKNTTSKK